MKILAIDKYEEPVVKEIENNLKDMQRYVMGHIETITLSETAMLVCNDVGKLADLTPNRILKIDNSHDVIRGDFFICGWSGDEFCETEADYVFCPFKSAIKKSPSPQLSDYGKVYRGIFEFSDTFEAKRVCERLYMEHNGVILDRKGRPMSISDIIVMHLPNGDRYFYVDMFGFKEIKFDKNGKMMAAEKEVVKYKR